MVNILELREFAPETLVAYVQNRAEEIHQAENYLGPQLLPVRPIEDLEWAYLVGARGVPVMAEIVDYSSPAPIRSRRGEVRLVQGELLVIKRKYPVDVKLLAKLERVLRSRFTPREYADAIAQMYDDVDLVIRNILARQEWMRWQVLVTGRLEYRDERGLVVELDYQRPSENVRRAAVDWSDKERADPIADLIAACDWFEEQYGVRPARAVCRRATFSKMLQARKVLEYLYGRAAPQEPRPISPTELNELLNAYDLPGFAIYNAKVAVEDARTGAVTEQNLIPDDVVVLLPPSNVELGFLAVGPTPTEIMNAAGFGDLIQRLQRRPECVVRIYKEGEDPGVVYTLGESACAPVVPELHLVGILQTKP